MKNLKRITELGQLKEFVDVGINDDFFESLGGRVYILDEEIDKCIHVRPRKSHKGTFGHALIIAGSYGKMGSAILASKACLRSGVGLITSYVPSCGYEIMQISIPEAMCVVDENTKFITEFPEIEKYDAIGVGPGIGKDELTAIMLEKILQTAKQPLVVDADAINILVERKELLNQLPENTILTPHIKEFERLTGKVNSDAERFSKLREFSMKYKCIVVLKDAYTCISSSEGDFYFNTSGNQGMATGGSGDVLTGIITGLLAQKYEPLLAALLGVFKHGVAGDIASRDKGYNALIASDIIDNLKVDKDFR